MGRRSANEGSIYKRKQDGLWAAQYLVDTPDGETKRKYVYGKKRKDVAEKLAEALKERGEGLLLDAGSLTVAEFWRIGWTLRRNPCGSPLRPGGNRC